MSHQVVVNVDDPDDLLAGYGAAAKVRLERATTGAFSDATEIATQTILSGTTQYEFWDAGGSEASWYRSRYSAVAGAPFSSYSDGRQPGAPTAYATLDALREYIKPPDDTDDNLLSDLLVEASEYLNERCNRDFYRHPGVSGTEERTYTGTGNGVLYVREGIVSLSVVELAQGTGQAYASLTASDWTYWPADAQASYEAVLLSDVGSYPEWYSGLATIRLTGVFGWEEPPAMIRQATLDLARQRYQQAHGGAETIGINQFGTPVLATGLPLSVREAIERYGWRTLVH